MRLHLLNARRLAEELAAGRVRPREQAAYLAITSVAWLVPSYFGIWSYPATVNEPFSFAYHWTEFAMLVLVNVVGVFYCLRQCRIEPARHFLVDFTCLFAPVALVVLTVTWALFHGSVRALPYVVDVIARDDFRTANYLLLRLHDLLLYITVVGQACVMYWVVGRYMRRAAELRA
jgi:hypothetical protein